MKKFFNGAFCLKNDTGNNGSGTVIFHKHSKVSKCNKGKNSNKFSEDNSSSESNKGVFLNLTHGVAFFLLFFIFALALFFLPVSFNIEAALATSPSPFFAPLPGEFNVTFRQEYFDEIELVTRKHTGVDIAGRPGDKVIASGNGIVTYTGFSSTGGRTVVIKHNDKIRSTYLNILDCFVTRGEVVSQGDNIATIGAFDDPSLREAHLHFGIIYMDSYLDPKDVLDIDYTSISRFISLEYIKPDDSLQLDPGQINFEKLEPFSNPAY